MSRFRRLVLAAVHPLRNERGVFSALAAIASAVAEAVAAAGSAVGSAAGAAGSALGSAAGAVGGAVGDAAGSVSSALGIGAPSAAGSATPAAVGSAVSLPEGAGFAGEMSTAGGGMTSAAVPGAAPGIGGSITGSGVSGGAGGLSPTLQKFLSESIQQVGKDDGKGGGEHEATPPPALGGPNHGLLQLPGKPQSSLEGLWQALQQRRAKQAGMLLGGQ
ncbi:hypothetical protein EPO05_06165 [Patescibacteria group bacterium]|nr:MAG: hypothetical protein EPO05_06165 [Patescibacteria group bacterium]